MQPIFQLFRFHIEQGNINRAWNMLTEHWGQLAQCHRSFGLRWLSRHLESGGSLTAATRGRIAAVVPGHFLSAFGLQNIAEATGLTVSVRSQPGTALCLCAAAEGYVRELRVFDSTSRVPRHLHVLDPIGREVVRVLRRCCSHHLMWDPLHYDFTLLDCHGREDNSVNGDSLDLALALALISHITGQPIPPNLVAQGVLDADGRVAPVGALDCKLEALTTETDGLPSVIVSASQAPPRVEGIRLLPVADLEQAARAVWPGGLKLDGFAHVNLDPDLELLRIDDLYDAYLIESCLENTGNLLAYLKTARIGADRKAKAQFTCHWRRGSCYAHQGDPVPAEREIKRAIRTYKRYPGAVERGDYLSLRNSYGVLLKDCFAYARAEQLHREIDRDLRRIGETDHERGCNLSSLSQLLGDQGRFEEAIKYQKLAVLLVDEEETHRNLGCLARIYSLSNQLRKASATMSRARKRLADYPDRRHRDQPFLDWTEAELRYRWGRRSSLPATRGRHWRRLWAIAETYPEFDSRRLVISMIHKFAALAWLDCGRIRQGRERLAEVIASLQQRPYPAAGLLAASAVVARGEFWCETGALAEARNDLRQATSLLESYNPYRSRFSPQLRAARRWLSQPAGNHSKQLRQCRRLLDRIRRKIPY